MAEDQKIYGFYPNELWERGYTTDEPEHNPDKASAMINGQLDITFGLIRHIKHFLDDGTEEVMLWFTQDNLDFYITITIRWEYYDLFNNITFSYQDFINEDTNLYQFLTEAKAEYAALFEVEHHPGTEPDSEIWQAVDDLQRAKKLKVSSVSPDGRVSFREDS